MSLASQVLPTNMMNTQKATQRESVAKTAESFRDRFDGDKASVEDRKANATTMVNEYYDLVTDFYEYGWGQAFHFSPRYMGESFFDGLIRHEHFLALQGGFKEGDNILDIGCGVGGPLRNIVRFSRASVVGINNNAYQIGRARRYDAKMGLSNKTDYQKTDFCNMPFADNEYDGAYAIEATCHAEDKVKCYSEVLRVIKPGSSFVAYEWVVTPKYDHTNETHRKIRHGIEIGDALPTLETGDSVVQALKDAGFIVEEAFDMCERFESSPAKTLTWYSPLEGNYKSLWGIKATPMGRWFTNKMCGAMEFMHLAPKGTVATADILEEGAVNLVLGGQTGTFTPCYFFRARKPAQ